MENINIQTQKKIENYQPSPDLFYDIEGKVLNSDGKKVTLEKEVGFQVMEYTLELKEEKDLEVGEKVKIDKEDIRSLNVEKREEVLPEDVEDIGQILRALGLDNTNANIVMVNKLIRQGIRPSKVNISNYMRSLDNLGRLEEEMDLDSLVKILDKSVDIEGLRLDQVLDQLDGLREKPKGLLDFLFSKKDMDYDQAQAISREIFGQKMGRDVYDLIIAMDRENIEINQENIERGLELMGKLASLKDVDVLDLTRLIKQDLDFTINNLHRLKKNYTKGPLEENEFAPRLEKLTIEKEADYTSLLKTLEEEKIQASPENISLARDFILLDMDIDSSRLDRLKSMKTSLDFVREQLEPSRALGLMEARLDLENMELDELAQLLDQGIDLEAGQLVDLSFLDQVQARDLLGLLKSGRDFRLKDLRNVVESRLPKEETLDFKVLDRGLKIGRILEELGPRPSLKNISLAEDLSLVELYDQVQGQEAKQSGQDQAKKDLLLVEYERFRDNISTSLIRQALNDSLNLEELPLAEANSYMEDKLNKYKQASRLMEDFKAIYENKELILPSIINNDLNMDYGSLRELANFLGARTSLSKTMERLMPREEGQARQEVEKKRELLSNRLKDGQDIRGDYFELMDLLSNMGQEADAQPGQGAMDQYIATRTKASKQDLIFQLPVDIEGFKDLNIIIPDLNKGIDKNRMNFRLALETENLGKLNMDLALVGRNIYLETRQDIMDNYGQLLREKLDKSGYKLVWEGL